MPRVLGCTVFIVCLVRCALGLGLQGRVEFSGFVAKVPGS